MNPVARLLEMTDRRRGRWAGPALLVLGMVALFLVLGADMAGAAGFALFLAPLALTLGVAGRLAALTHGQTREDLLSAGITPALLVDGGCRFVASRSALWGLALVAPLWVACVPTPPVGLLAAPLLAAFVVAACTLMGVGLYHPAVLFHVALQRLPAAARPLLCLVLLGGYAWVAGAALCIPWWLRDFALQVHPQGVSRAGSTLSALAVQLALGISMVIVMRAIAVHAVSVRMGNNPTPPREWPSWAPFGAVLAASALLNGGDPTATAVCVLLFQSLRVYADTVPTLARDRQSGALEALALTGMTSRELVDGRAWGAVAPRLAESLVLAPLAVLGEPAVLGWLSLLVPAAAWVGLWDSSSGRAGLPFRGLLVALGLLVTLTLALRTPALVVTFPVWLGLLARGLALHNLRQEGDRPGFVR